MSTSATPKQGDHVFNAIDTALMRPFDSIGSLRSAEANGQHFIHEFLLHSYSLARKMAETTAQIGARKLVASAGAEENALREIANLRPRNPTLVRITPSLLRTVHLRNSDHFGHESDQYEREALTLIQRSLEKALTTATANLPAVRMPLVSIACQRMLGAAYDPAAALVVIADSVSVETLPVPGILHNVVVGIADTLDRPAMWKDPFSNFRENRASVTGKRITDIRDALTQIDLLKAQSMTFPALIKDEIAFKSRSRQVDAQLGAMLHLVHAKLQQMH